MDNSVYKNISDATENVLNEVIRCGYFRDEEEFGAGNETRTRDPDLGKVVLYQLSYSRVTAFFAIFRWRRNLHFCVVTGGALYENSMPLQPPDDHFFAFFV